ncbi:hypothetical protein ZHAS_00015694 [Anopheles sinensis]|uniref:Uncharacterized protein n=1 Tax=Anopheles sinensis TaxID=74873 RepID=A0A084WBQ7_ANOSI|nr:hypothetical protein ZHAS_00015694 [Anopheles sinensis]
MEDDDDERMFEHGKQIQSNILTPFAEAFPSPSTNPQPGGKVTADDGTKRKVGRSEMGGRIVFRCCIRIRLDTIGYDAIESDISKAIGGTKR